MNYDRPLSPMLALRVEAARGLGCEVEILDPETGYLCEIRRGARKVLLLGGFSPLNGVSAARIAEDKFHTGAILRRAGFRVLPAGRCLKPGRFRQEDFSSHTGFGPAEAFADEHGFPLVVKPNRGSRGRDVTVVRALDELRNAVEQIWRTDYLALVQPVADGLDVRLDFLDGEFLFGYLRRPVVLTGDSTSTLAELLARCDPRFSGEAFRRSLADEEIWNARTRGHLGLESVLDAGDVLDLATPILNLNRLCAAEIVRALPPGWLEAGRRSAATLGLRHCGIDFKAAGLASDPAAAVVLEVNAAPSLMQMSRMGFYDETLAAETRVVEAILEAPL